MIMIMFTVMQEALQAPAVAARRSTPVFGIQLGSITGVWGQDEVGCINVKGAKMRNNLHWGKHWGKNVQMKEGDRGIRATCSFSCAPCCQSKSSAAHQANITLQRCVTGAANTSHFIGRKLPPY